MLEAASLYRKPVAENGNNPNRPPISPRDIYAECIYCGAYVLRQLEDEKPPEIDEEQVWESLAEEHYTGCEWVGTRAHRINTDRYYATLEEIAARVERARIA